MIRWGINKAALLRIIPNIINITAARLIAIPTSDATSGPIT